MTWSQCVYTEFSRSLGVVFDVYIVNEAEYRPRFFLHDFNLDIFEIFTQVPLVESPYLNSIHFFDKSNLQEIIF